jgi:predicted RNA binding protein YcfA (HicA-like mRNA interferase family)
MSQRRKRIEKILRRPTRMTFAEVEKILEDFGMQLYRTKGSHSWFKGAGNGQICVPKAGGRWVEGCTSMKCVACSNLTKSISMNLTSVEERP